MQRRQAGFEPWTARLQGMCTEHLAKGTLAKLSGHIINWTIVTGPSNATNIIYSHRGSQLQHHEFWKFETRNNATTSWQNYFVI